MLAAATYTTPHSTNPKSLQLFRSLLFLPVDNQHEGYLVTVHSALSRSTSVVNPNRSHFYSSLAQIIGITTAE